MSDQYEGLSVSLREKGEFYELGVTVGDYFLTFGGGNLPELQSRLKEAAEAKQAESGSTEPTTPA